MKYIPPYGKKINGMNLIHRAIPKRNDRRPFIYFLLKRKKVVYIGKTNHFRMRLHDHNCYKDFDRVRLIECPNEMLDYYERRWIEIFQPKYNITHTEKRKLPFLERKY